MALLIVILLLLLLLMPTLTTPFTNLPKFSLESDMNSAKAARAELEAGLLSRPLQIQAAGSAWSYCKPTKRRSSPRSDPARGFGSPTSTSSNPSSSQPSSTSLLPPLTSPKLSVSEGHTFSTELIREGFLRINGALSPTAASKLRHEVLAVQVDVLAQCSSSSSFNPESVYGTEPGRTNRTDLLLPFDTEVQNSMTELFVSGGPLRSLFEELVGPSGIFYEMAAIITSSGADRQIIHPDLPWRDEAPLYVCFCALQDCTLAMGPTSFLPKSNDLKTRQIYDAGGSGVDDMLSASEVSTPCLKAGDVVIFDARTLHAGCANTDGETTRCLYNFSFRTTAFHDDLGYKGSMRSGYDGKINLGDVMKSADEGGQKLGGELGDGLGGWE